MALKMSLITVHGMRTRDRKMMIWIRSEMYATYVNPGMILWTTFRYLRATEYQMHAR